MSYDNEMTGVLFGNDKRETDKHPNAKGSAQINGVEYWVSAWTNTDKNGRKYQSLKFQPKEQRAEQRTETRTADDFNDAVPF